MSNARVFLKNYVWPHHDMFFSLKSVQWVVLYQSSYLILVFLWFILYI